MLKIALASPPFAGTIAGSLRWVAHYIAAAADQGADIVCFPETYVPGLRGQDFEVDDVDGTALEDARTQICQLAAAHHLCVIAPMEWPSARGLLNLAFVISANGEVLGRQTKNQIAPEEDGFYVPGDARAMFSIKGVPFGISICHEGWRYPESVRWAAVNGARIVFHPQLVGSDRRGVRVRTWGAADSPYYEKAMVCRSLENSIYFASVNYACEFQGAATAVITPDGQCLAHLPYSEAGLLLTDVDPAAADRQYAHRFAPETYRADTPG